MRPGQRRPSPLGPSWTERPRGGFQSPNDVERGQLSARILRRPGTSSPNAISSFHSSHRQNNSVEHKLRQTGTYQDGSTSKYTGLSSFGTVRFSTKHLRAILKYALVALVVILFFLFSGGSQDSFVAPASINHEGMRKGVVVASYRDQDVSWIDDMPADWEIYRYVMDDPTAQYHPPVNAGREAMAYLTFIIDHYDKLPDYMVFIHGHERAWHQPEPIQWRLPTLNLTALDQDQYVSLHCLSESSCNPAPRLRFGDDWTTLDQTARLIPWFWRFANISSALPESLSWPDGAQFAVTKSAVHHRTLDWWTRYRSPIFNDDAEMDRYNYRGYYWGLLHERLWHVAFGKTPIYCPNQDYCTAVQWSNGVLCDMYPALPLWPRWVRNKDIPQYVKCFKNSDKTLYWPMRRWSLCNVTAYMDTDPPDCPFSGFPLP